jgi:hypothetical protein
LALVHKWAGAFCCLFSGVKEVMAMNDANDDDDNDDDNDDNLDTCMMRGQ